MCAPFTRPQFRAELISGIGNRFRPPNFADRPAVLASDDVPIRFVFPANAADAVRTTYSPLTELSLSLRVLAAPQRHPLRHAWVRRMRRLPPDLRRRIRGFAFVYRCGIPDALFPPEEPRRSFAEELERVGSLDPGEVARDLETIIRSDRRVRDHVPPGCSAAELADVAVARLREHAPEEAATIRLLATDPAAAVAGLCSLLEEYWRASFREEWRTIGPLLATANAELEANLRRDFFASVSGLQRQLSGDPRTRSIAIDVRADGTLAAGDGTKFVIAPSTFLWPGVMVKFEPPGSPGFIYPVPVSKRMAADLAADVELIGLVKALADDTRLRALKLLSLEPRTTQELAPLLGITESGLSKHLRVLADAGLVRTRRESYYVVYSAVPERVASLSDALLHYIAVPGAGFAFGESVAVGEAR